MKYARLTKEQLDSLQQEFINFLATQPLRPKNGKLLKKSNLRLQSKNLMYLVIWFGKVRLARRNF